VFLIVDAFWLICVVFLIVDTILACLCSVSNGGRILAYFD
jgi:hypothetical protein